MNPDFLKVELERDEGKVRHVYYDGEGYATIGIGRMIDGRLNGGLSQDEIEYLLANDIRQLCKELDQALPWWTNLSDDRQRALCNMAFNLGLPRLLKFKNMLAAMKAGEFEIAAREALDSLWARQVGDRATRIAKLIYPYL